MASDHGGLTARRPPNRPSNRPPAWLVPALAAPPVLVAGLFYGLPVVRLVTRVVDGRSFIETLRAHGVAQVLWFTLWQAVVSTVATIVVALVPAYVTARYTFGARRVLQAVIAVPFMLPTVVVGAAFLALLPHHWNGTARAVIIAHVYFNIAVVVRLVGTMWSTIPTDLTGAARTLGASPVQVLRHVVAPILRPALVAASSVVFLFTFTSYGVVRILGGAAHSTIEVEVTRRALSMGDVAGATVLSIAQMAALGIVVWWSARVQRRAVVSLTAGRTRHSVRSRTQRTLVRTTSALTLLTMATPMVVLVTMSFRSGDGWSIAAWSGLGHTQIRPGIGLGVAPFDALATSLRYAALAMVASTVLGTCAALAIHAAPRFGRVLDIGLMLPLATSAVTVGLGLLITFDTAPFDWRGRWWMAPLGHTLIATPFVVRSMLPTIRSISVRQVDAALTLGASPTRAWWWAIVRRLRRSVAAGAGFAAAISLGEFGASTLLTRSGHDTVPLAIAKLLGRTGAIPRAQGFALATILLVVCATIVALVEPASREAN